jgi:hypothetical protein
VNRLRVSDDNNLLAFTRSDEADEFLVVINFSDRPVNGAVEVTKSAEFKPVKISGTPDAPAGDLSRLRLNGLEWRIYYRALARQ